MQDFDLRAKIQQMQREIEQTERIQELCAQLQRTLYLLLNDFQENGAKVSRPTLALMTALLNKMDELNANL